jgi:hypothetical protein
MRANPIRESGYVAEWEMGKAPRSLHLTGASGRTPRPKKKGQPVGRPVYEWNEALNMMFISIFPGNFSRAPSLRLMNRSFFRTCCMYSDLTSRLLLLRESALRFSAIPNWLSNDQHPLFKIGCAYTATIFRAPDQGNSASIGFLRPSGECRKCFRGEFVRLLSPFGSIAGEAYCVRRLVKAREYVKL